MTIEDGYESYTIDELVASEELRKFLIGRHIKRVYTGMSYPEVGEFQFQGAITTVTPESSEKSEQNALYVWTKYGAFLLSSGTIVLEYDSVQESRH